MEKSSSTFIIVLLAIQGAPNPVLVMELKNITLLNLWKARQGSPSANPRSQNEYKPLLDYLHEAKEDLLKLNFSFYHKGLGLF
jgi:hypothetical protein